MKEEKSDSTNYDKVRVYCLQTYLFNRQPCIPCFKENRIRSHYFLTLWDDTLYSRNFYKNHNKTTLFLPMGKEGRNGLMNVCFSYK